MSEVRDDQRRRGAHAKPQFTGRQVQVVQLLAVGYTYAQIGDALGIGERTVQEHATVVARKLGVRGGRRVPLAYMQVTGDSPWPQLRGAP